MTDRERFERAFAPVRASADTVTEVLKMTDANRKPRRAGAARRAARAALIAAIIFVLLIRQRLRRRSLRKQPGAGMEDSAAGNTENEGHGHTITGSADRQ